MFNISFLIYIKHARYYYTSSYSSYFSNQVFHSLTFCNFGHKSFIYFEFIINVEIPNFKVKIFR